MLEELRPLLKVPATGTFHLACMDRQYQQNLIASLAISAVLVLLMIFLLAVSEQWERNPTPPGWEERQQYHIAAM